MSTAQTKAAVKVVPHDDGLALVFDPALLREFGIDENTPVSVTHDGQSIRITPAATYPTQEQVAATMKVVNKEWGSVLKKLADQRAMSIVFLDRDAVLQIHHDQINLYGGDPSLRDQRLLDSAVAMPQAAFGGQWLHEFPHGMAAAYLFHHPFVDGNKRTGAAASVAFLQLNGFRMAPLRDEFYELVLSVARGEARKEAVVEYFNQHVTR